MNAWWWIVLTLVCIAIQSFYSMSEMALVSFNKVRLQYWVDKGKRRASWVHRLLQNPARLFGTTLLGVNIALQVGSQCSREVYIAFGIDPAIAPLTQVFLVMIFAELAPLFAARRYAERVVMLSIPIIYISSLIMKPVIWVIALISSFANWLVRGPRGPTLSLLSREELQHLVTEGSWLGAESGGSDDFNVLVTNIFNFRKKVAREVMTPLQALHMLPADATVEAVSLLLGQYDVPCVPVYFRTRRNVVAVAFARDLVKVDQRELARAHARNPWFITQSMPVGQILRQFRFNNQSVAVVLDHDGQTVGLVTLDDILDELFGESPQAFHPRPRRATRRRALIEKTMPADTRIIDFNREFGAHLKADGIDSLGQLLAKQLGHAPEKGESIRVGNFELTVLEATLLGPRTISVRSLL